MRMRLVGPSTRHMDEAGKPHTGKYVTHILDRHTFTSETHIWPRAVSSIIDEEGYTREPNWEPSFGQTEEDRPRGTLLWASEDGETASNYTVVGPNGTFGPVRLPYDDAPLSYAAWRVLGKDETDHTGQTLLAIMEENIADHVTPYVTAAQAATILANEAAINANAAADNVVVVVSTAQSDISAAVASAQSDVSAAVASAGTASATALSSATYATSQGNFALAAAQGTDTMVFTLDQMPDVPLPGRRIVVHAYGRIFWYHGGGIWRDPFGEVLDTFLIPISLGVAQFSRNSEGMFTPEPGA
jgi:hypothetical protein